MTVISGTTQDTRGGRHSYRFIGRGLYTIAEAGQLARVPGQTIRRWLIGYRFAVASDTHASPPVVDPELGRIHGIPALTFLDLQEIRFVAAFRAHGVSWSVIRRTHELAQRELQNRHPFATGRFLTDGRSLLLEYAGASGVRSHALLNIVRSQFEFRRIVAPFLKELDFADNQAVRWWPSAGRRRVVIDPLRNFGKAVLSREGVPTSALARTYAVEESYDRVASWYEVPPASVRLAVEFERQLAA